MMLTSFQHMITDTWTHINRQPENRMPSVADRPRRHKNWNISLVFPSTFQALSARPTSFLQCFDTVGLVI